MNTASSIANYNILIKINYKYIYSFRRELNPGSFDYKSNALPLGHGSIVWINTNYLLILSNRKIL